DPVLLIIDDLERILQTPRAEDVAAAVTPTAEYLEPLGAVLRAVALAQTTSRLLLTSRYDIRCPDSAGGDLAVGLIRVPLTPMLPRERVKQFRAAERQVEREDSIGDDAAEALLNRAMEVAAGNPGLQALLTRPIIAGELAVAEAALGQIGVYRDTGAPPD